MEIKLSKLISMLLKQWKIIVVSVLTGFFAALLATVLFINPTYKATAKINVYAVTQSAPGTAGANINELNYARQIMDTYVECLRVQEFYNEVSDLLNNAYTPSQIRNMVSFATSADTLIFNASIIAGTPEDALKVAQAVVTNIPLRISKAMQDSDSAAVRVVEKPTKPTAKASPNTTLNCMIGFVLGGVAAVVLILLKEMLDVRVKSEDDLIDRYNIPLLGSVPDFDPDRKKKKGGLSRG